MGGGPRVKYPKHVWSPSGGWYCQPANWKANTAALGGVCLGIVGMTFYLCAQRETRYRMPEPHQFFPSRYWSKQILDHERAKAAQEKSDDGT